MKVIRLLSLLCLPLAAIAQTSEVQIALNQAAPSQAAPAQSKAALPSSGQSGTNGNILVRNVTLIDPRNQVADKVVNILIKNNKLEVVTEDKISSDESDIVVNADKGILLGRLEIGESPSFIIFNADPREKFDVLLDTKAYSVFAVEAGSVIKNDLGEIFKAEPEDEPLKSGWLSYTPPPFMVPLNYRDSSRWNQWQTRYSNGTFVSFLALDRMYWLDQDAGSKATYPALDLYNGGEIRGFRFGVVGSLNFKKPWIYTIFAATNAFDRGYEIKDEDTLALYDYRLDIPFFNHSSMSIGKQKEPISMERLTSTLFLSNQERSGAADAMLPARNFGVRWSGNHPERYTSWAFGVFKNFIDAPTSFSDTATEYIGRITWAPLVSEDESNLLHLGLGYRYSDAKNGFIYRTEPEFTKAPLFLDTGVHEADKTEIYNIELAWLRGPFLLTSEYTNTSVDNPALGNPVFNGYFVNLAWTVTGEMRSYNKKGGVFGGIPVAKSVYQGGKGAWEVYARYSDTDLQDGTIDGGQMQIMTVGLNWWLTSYMALDAGYKYIDSQSEGVDARTSGALLRLLLVLQ